jgi:AcrR family transcriptional regulator
MSDLREKILASACDLYLQEGLEGLSMRKLARRVGLTAPALYRYYESKEHVLADVLREAYRAFAQYLYRGLEGQTPEERLMRAGDGFLDFALEHPRWYRMIYMPPERLGMVRVPDDIASQGCGVHQFWVDRLRECMATGLLRDDDPVQVGLTMWAHSHGLITLYYNGHFRTDEKTFRQQYRTSGLRLLLGIATDAYGEELTRRLGAEPSALRA